MTDHVTPKITAAGSRVCTQEDFKDSVYLFETEHFALYYTMTGIHAIAGADNTLYQIYLDTMAFKLEEAYRFYTDSIGMVLSAPHPVSYQYSQPVITGKYTVEIIDVHHIRDDKRTDFRDMVKNQQIYGFVSLSDASKQYTYMFVENDYHYTPQGTAKQSFTTDTGSECFYYASPAAITSGAVSYANETEKAFDVTVTHELYHAFQFEYETEFTDLHFWFEASATGMEEVLSPDINDYWQYTDLIFQSPQESMLEAGGTRKYGQGLFLQYLFHNYPYSIEKEIWEHRRNNQGTDMITTFDAVLSNNYSTPLDSVQNDYYSHLLLSGSRSSADPNPFSQDMSNFYTITPAPISDVIQKGDDATLTLSKPLSSKMYDLSSLVGNDPLYVSVRSGVTLSLIEIDTIADTAEITALKGPTITLIGDSLTKPAYLNFSSKKGGSENIQLTQTLEDIFIFDGPSKLYPPYPNPYNYRVHSGADITFPSSNIPEGTTIRILSRKGVVVQTLKKESGVDEIVWKGGLSSQNKRLPSGYYYYIDTYHNKPGKIILLN